MPVQNTGEPTATPFVYFSKFCGSAPKQEMLGVLGQYYMERSAVEALKLMLNTPPVLRH
jgi:hypothetical protein